MVAPDGTCRDLSKALVRFQYQSATGAQLEYHTRATVCSGRMVDKASVTLNPTSEFVTKTIEIKDFSNGSKPAHAVVFSGGDLKLRHLVVYFPQEARPAGSGAGKKRRRKRGKRGSK
jgi:hypothetical protein